MGYLCTPDGRESEAKKILKIIDWPTPRDLTEMRAFLGVCVYYRIWIAGFAVIAAPLYALLRKDESFLWGVEQHWAMQDLKAALVSAPILMPINYEVMEERPIIVGVDTSLHRWGGYLGQESKDQICRHVIRYKSGIWSKAEIKYNTRKQEC